MYGTFMRESREIPRPPVRVISGRDYAVPGNDAPSSFLYQVRRASGSGRCGAAASDTGSPGSGWAASRPDGYPRPA